MLDSVWKENSLRLTHEPTLLVNENFLSDGDFLRFLLGAAEIFFRGVILIFLNHDIWMDSKLPAFVPIPSLSSSRFLNIVRAVGANPNINAP